MALARKQDRLSKQLKLTKTLWIAYNKVYSFLILHNQKCAPAALCLNCHSKIHPLSVITELECHVAFAAKIPTWLLSEGLRVYLHRLTK